MNIEALRERLHKIQKKESTLDLTDPKRCLKGDSPEDWLEYIEQVQGEVTFPSQIAQHEALSELFDRAFKELNADKHKYSEAYAQLFVAYGRLKSGFVPDDASMIFNQARAISRRFAVVHLASAQFELERDNPGKAKKILQKALLFEAKPKEEIEAALEKLKHGEKTIYRSPVTRYRRGSGNSGSRVGSSGSEPTDELTSSSQISNTSLNLSACITASFAPKLYPAGEPLSSRKPLPARTGTHVSRSHDPATRQSDGTFQDFLVAMPEVSDKSGDHTSTMPTDNAGPGHNVAIVARRDRSSIEPPYTDSVLNMSVQSSRLTAEVGLGLLSSDTDRCPVSACKGQQAGRLTLDGSQLPPAHPGTGIPHDSSVHKHGMRTFRSTPLLHSEKRPVRCTAPPARIRKINLPFEPLNGEEDEDEDDAMDTMDSFKPLDKSGFNNHAHTSGYLSMVSDSTIAMETKPLEKQVMDPLREQEEPPLCPPSSLPAPRLAPHHTMAPPAGPSPQTPAHQGPLRPHPGAQQIVTPARPAAVPPAVTPMGNMKMIAVNDKVYTVLSVLGRGGSCKVYQVFDPECSKVKALKEVYLDSAVGAVVEGYKNEIALLRRLQYCDKVIKMYDSEYKPDEAKLYMVMEAGSEDLAMFFQRETQNRKHLNSVDVRFYWRAMLQAVQALHREGIIHSDLKPANFLFVGGTLKLIDFGIAKAIQQDKTSVILEAQIGTLNFMSPETIMHQHDGSGSKPQFKVGVKSDVWSLGCILYNIVFGRTPFQHIRNNLLKLQAITNPDLPIEFPDCDDKHVIDVLKRCLNRDPKQRPSIDELLDHPYLTGNEVSEPDKKSPPLSERPLDTRMEAFVKNLASQLDCSPGGIRNLVYKTMTSDEGSSAGCHDLAANLQRQSTISNQKRPVAPPPSMAQPPSTQGGQVKRLRAPLNPLNLQDLKQPAPIAHGNQRRHEPT
ncbi:dual specificity protein kinase Ttk-like isoform X2 [Dreissena polymorpha]|uniref:dual specificity protein kinase Ttk-like isoform X2 n=1 Tax=Dreissena polymorpha TaxID=45954 RepID=UPI002263B637|nr:dual specificity protein kinase Ttk-like isoform X2 [Dreissena polymorpha]